MAPPVCISTRLAPRRSGRPLSSMSEPIAYVLGIAVLVVGAFTILAVRDKSRSKKLAQQLQRRLGARQDCSDAELISTFPLQREKEIALKFRSQLAKALGVEAQKIRPDDDLHADYHLDTMWPFLIAAIASEFTLDPSKTGSQQVLSFQDKSTTFRDFVRAISQRSP
jgi:hypothetical protein